MREQVKTLHKHLDQLATALLEQPDPKFDDAVVAPPATTSIASSEVLRDKYLALTLVTQRLIAEEYDLKKKLRVQQEFSLAQSLFRGFVMATGNGATSCMAGNAELPTTPVSSISRRSRLSVSHANALANFDLLLGDLSRHRLVVFLDYDGTLTPIVNDPAKLYYAGSHGFDIVGPNGTSIKNQVAVEFVAHLQQVRDALAHQVVEIPGAEVEDNIYSVSLHYRNVDPSRHQQIATIAQNALVLHPQLRCNEGKMVYEFKPKMDWNKGKALVWLLQALGLDEHEDVFTIYIGDDTTDEDAFDVFRTKPNRKGVGIIVTDHSKSTGASFTLHDTQEVYQFLNRLADLHMDVQHRDFIGLKWSDGHISKYHLQHLRSWCLCPACQHETGQRLVNSADIAEELEIRDMFVALDRRARDMATTALQPGAPIPEVEYDRMMESDEGLLEMLHQVIEHGFTVVKNTPSEPRQVKKVAERVAPVSHSFLYGDVFDVIAEQNPVNIAYTNHHLKHHLDLAYYESPPGFQLLHALRFDKTVQGGESTFVDVFAVAEAFRQQHPDHFLTFCRVPATFKKHHLNRSNPAVMEYQRPHIQLNHREEVVAVHWSPPFEGPLRVPFDDVQSYYAAYRVFHELVEGGAFKVQFKLQQGDTVMFNQRRVLHGRNHFSIDSSGVRHLQGTYINIDDALCRYNALRHRFAPNSETIKNRRVANGNFS
ncbi:hypothetical protein ATCC90586_002483 [Pythium insidiosum]|nr:hypothetical protein ATCC90586_002483 [Pythium insidiosum]